MIALPIGVTGGTVLVTRDFPMDTVVEFSDYAKNTVVLRAVPWTDGRGGNVWRLLLAVPK